MAKIFGDSEGRIIRMFILDEDERHGDPPGFVSSLTLDGETNAATINDIGNNYLSFRLIGGVLYKGENPVSISAPGDKYISVQAIKNDYPNMPTWAKTGTAADAETYILGQVWSGQTAAQVNTWIDANITNITTANVSQINARLLAIRNGLKLAGGAVIALRDLFILTAKLLIYIRDLVIRFRVQ